MMVQSEFDQIELTFHDKIAKRVKVDVESVQRLLKYNSPAGYFGNRLPGLKSRLLSFIGNVENRRVLIYGCGTDGAALWFAKSGAYVDAIDISPHSIEVQKKRAHIAQLQINAMVMDAHDLEFNSDLYDIVYGNAILHHLNTNRAASEIYRVLKKNGKGVFREVIDGNIFLKLFRLATPLSRTPNEHPLKNSDFAVFENYFRLCDIKFYVLFGLPLFFIIRIVNNVILNKVGINSKVPIYDFMYSTFDKFDQIAFSYVPFLKMQAWICLMTFIK